MSREKECKCCHEWWYASVIKEDLCPNCYYYFKQLKQELDQQKAMWNELRSFLDEDKLFEYFAESSVDGYKNCLLSIKNKMQELEQGEKDE